MTTTRRAETAVVYQPVRSRRSRLRLWWRWLLLAYLIAGAGVSIGELASWPGMSDLALVSGAAAGVFLLVAAGIAAAQTGG